MFFLSVSLLTHPVLSPELPKLGGAGLAVLWGGGVTEEEMVAELTGVMGQDAEGEGVAPEKRSRWM